MQSKFNYDLNIRKSLTLYLDNIEPLNIRMYKAKELFYLCDNNDQYLSHLKFNYIVPEAIKLIDFFEVSPGFFELLVKLILVKSPINFIFNNIKNLEKTSDPFNKLIAKLRKSVYNTHNKEIEIYEIEKENEYTQSNKYLVGISELQSHFHKRITMGENLLNTRKDRGIDVHTPVEILFRYYGLDESDAIEMTKLFPEEF